MATKKTQKSRKPARRGSRSGSNPATKSKSVTQQNRASEPASEESALLEFLVEEVKDIYWAEKHLVKALPRLQDAANSSELKDAIGNHLEETKNHVERLERVFGLLGEKVQAKKCDAMEGLVEEAEGVIEDTEDGTSTRDVGIIMSAQKAEHYEIAVYGSLTQLAKTIGRSDIADVLAQTLEEEKKADETLTSIAESGVNQTATEEEPAE